MLISEVARAADCSVRAIRHMHAVGAVPEPQRHSNGYRNYSVSDLAAVLRARTLIDAGVPLSDINAPDALKRALTLIDDQLAQLELQRSKLVHLLKSPAGTPPDIREALFAQFGDSPWVRHELDSLDLMALAGVATPKTWQLLRTNVADPACIEASHKAAQLWDQLGTNPPARSATRSTSDIAEELLELLRAGIMRGTLATLRQGDSPLNFADLPTTGAQGNVLTQIERLLRA